MHTGPNPTDRAKPGCKRHAVTEAQGLPLVVRVTPANLNDSLPAIDLLDAIPPVPGPTGGLRFRPDIFQGDIAYGTPRVLSALKDRRVAAQIAPRANRPPHGSGLGRFRYVVERTLAWFSQFRRLKLCYERKPNHAQAFHSLAAAVICARRLMAHVSF